MTGYLPVGFEFAAEITYPGISLIELIFISSINLLLDATYIYALSPMHNKLKKIVLG